MGSVDVPMWLRELPLAPEFRPTETEFADPIAYITKIEKESSDFGICKIIPPMPKPSKRFVLHNLNKSLSKCPELGEDVNVLNGNDGETRAIFTTRQQELGQGVRKIKGDSQQPSFRKQVWQSGEVYTLEQFEYKSKTFAKSILGMIKDVNPLVVESMFWKAASEKPIYVEYANDVPGSGFSEPVGHFRHSKRKARKRESYKSYRRDQENSRNMRIESYERSAPQNAEVKHCSLDNDVNAVEIEKMQSLSGLVSSHDETSMPTKRKETILDMNMEGSSGWKLSNSPWNIQVIARSPGSLTRYMPDDIPGVTSPMVYIGMLFSWFAWHVEDHELHSLNFLHTGSPKTWYAISGDYAPKFEEVIRTKAYGEHVDRLAALRMLGEKTTLLSPEVIVGSDIPCCRLVQNPGEFVVTFPKAYHVGFSHGFNCGEAANFGTSQWLRVAKEAAVRRASMNYLPMLSHQQLMYLLTMSFVSRVPRSLLPGVRCSRHRDRQREDREISVKKAFIKDVVEENQMLSVLLERSSAFRAVLWNAELLPCVSRENQLLAASIPDANAPSQESPDAHMIGENRNFVEEMELYMENLDNLYMDNDDLSNDFQIDSGTLECVACGILGFPFMCVIQPSRLEPIADPSSDQCPSGDIGASKKENGPSDSNDSTCLPHSPLPDKEILLPDRWISSQKNLRPRLFCLEHGIQVEELLTSKGGGKILIICHSDYQKMKAHAAVIAEELGTPYNYRDVSIDMATQEELNLIDSAIDNENHTELGEDWTSSLKINLQHCLRVRKHSPSKQYQHALSLGVLFSEENNTSSSSIKWQSRRSRTKIKTEQSSVALPLDKKNDGVPFGEASTVPGRLAKKLIQYTRRKLKGGACLARADSREGTQNGKASAQNPVVRSFNDGACSSTEVNEVNQKTMPGNISSMGSCVEEKADSLGLGESLNVLQLADRVIDDAMDRINSIVRNDVTRIPDATSNWCSPIIVTGDKIEERQGFKDNVVSHNLIAERQREDCDVAEHVCPSPRYHPGAESSVSSLNQLEGPSIGKSLDDGFISYPSMQVKENDISASGDVLNATTAGGCNEQMNSIVVGEEELRSQDSSIEVGKLCSSEKERDIVVSLNDRKRKKSVGNQLRNGEEFLRGPCEGLRPRAAKLGTVDEFHSKKGDVRHSNKMASHPKACSYKCDIEGCHMSFDSNAKLLLHKRNQCPHQGCRKKFSSHRYALIHQRVHKDDRPLSCPWKGCSMTFKWAWARTEHIRVHTGEKPYQCKAEGCGRSFRFVSDFSRHRRTGHNIETSTPTS